MAIVKQTLAEWQAEVKECTGDPPDPAKLAFRCGRCENVATAEDFIAVGQPADRAATSCIGRFVDSVDCDWAAWGLLGCLNGRVLTKPDGDTIQVFEFAEVPAPSRGEQRG